MSDTLDAIVIGAGHNGLVAAATLARKGLKTLVLEARNHVGGMLGDDEFRIAPLPFGLRPQVAASLGISLPMRPVETVIASHDGAPMRINGGIVSGASTDDAERYAVLHERLTRQAAALSGLLEGPPPDLDRASWSQLLQLGKTGLKLRRLGKADLRDLMRIALSNVWDLTSDELDDGPLAGAMAFDATLGNAMGPRSPGTVLPLLWRMTGGSPAGMRMMPEAGVQVLVDALALAVTSAGGVIRTGAPVEKIVVADDQVAGVRLANGAVIHAPLVMSNAEPGATLLKLLGPEHLDAEFVRRCRTVARDGMTARVDFLLSDPPKLVDGRELGQFQRLVVAPSLLMLERAFNRAKYGDIPTSPPCEAHFDQASGKLSVTVQFVSSKTDWTPDRREALEKAVLSSLEAALPGVTKLAATCRLKTPADIERDYNVPGGHWHHAEFRIDQLLMLRPFGGAAQYRMPVGGLYLCGAGTHPGGDVSGLPGLNAARTALAEGRN